MMKMYAFLVIGLISATVLACNPFKADHPQANLADDHKTTDLTANSILAYKDSVDKNLAQLPKSQSLMYKLGDLSFYVEQHGSDLFVAHTYNGAERNTIKKYYFRNDSLILYQVNNQLANEDGSAFKDERIFLRNHTVFKKDGRTAVSVGALKNMPFIDIPLNDTATPDQNYINNAKALKNVIHGTDKFDMVFESIRTYPDARYITLRNKEPNSYTANVLAKEKDAFIDSLLNYPILFKDKKLNLKWEIIDREAVYVPAKH